MMKLSVLFMVRSSCEWVGPSAILAGRLAAPRPERRVERRRVLITDGRCDFRKRLVGSGDEFFGAAEPQLAQMFARRIVPGLPLQRPERALAQPEQGRDIGQCSHSIEVLSRLPPRSRQPVGGFGAGRRWGAETVEQREEQPLAARYILVATALR